LSKSPTSRKAAATLWLADSRSVDQHELDSRMEWLTADEAIRYRRFVRPQRQRQFLIGRILLRIALGDLLGLAPDRISLLERAGRAPLLQGLDPVPGFSIAHSGAWAACAVSADVALGLDIEVRTPERDLAALAQQAFSSKEAHALTKLEGEARVRAFYELWSRKEAAYKLASSSMAAAGQQAHFASIPHPDMSIVLCSAQLLRDIPVFSWPV
jgi:4'-phosphopantetheinyl transferase